MEEWIYRGDVYVSFKTGLERILKLFFRSTIFLSLSGNFIALGNSFLFKIERLVRHFGQTSNDASGVVYEFESVNS